MLRILLILELIVFLNVATIYGNEFSVVKKIELAGDEIPNTNQIEAQYYQNNIKFYLNPSQNDKIYYRIFQDNSTQNVMPFIAVKDNFLHIHALKAGYVYKIELFRNNTLIERFQLSIRLPWWKTWRFAVIWIVVLAVFFLTRERTFHFHNLSKQKANDLKISELEIQSLQLQMNPHFISNTLNAIQNYIISRDKITAAEYLSKFSKLIRNFLESSRSKYNTLSYEIELLQTYIDLEKLRFNDKFDSLFVIDKAVDLSEEIPTMILQPYIENAINHGLRNKNGKGLLKIQVSNDADFVKILIEDNGVGRVRAMQFKANSLIPNKSLSLEIIEERIKIYQLSGYKIQVSTSDLLHNNTEGFVGDLVGDFVGDFVEDCGTVVVFKFAKK